MISFLKENQQLIDVGKMVFVRRYKTGFLRNSPMRQAARDNLTQAVEKKQDVREDRSAKGLDKVKSR